MQRDLRGFTDGSGKEQRQIIVITDTFQVPPKGREGLSCWTPALRVGKDGDIIE